MPKVFTKSCLFIVCKTMFTIGESQAISHANRTANITTPNCQYSQGKISHRKILWRENADLKFSFNGASNKDGDSTNKQRSRGNITQWMSIAKVLYEQMEAILDMSLNISADIAVTKHPLLADEFTPYRPRLLGFYSLHVNAIKCINVGVSLSKLQSCFWKISLNSRLIRFEALIIKFWRISLCVPRGLVVKLWPGGSKVERSIPSKTFFSSLFLFSSFFFFFLFLSFSFHFRYNSFVMFLNIAYNCYIYKFSSRLYSPFPRSPSRGPAIYVFLVHRAKKIVIVLISFLAMSVSTATSGTWFCNYKGMKTYVRSQASQAHVASVLQCKLICVTHS